MKALTLASSQESKLLLTQVQTGALKAHEVQIKVKAAALNHRDEWCRQGLYPNIQDGVILGSDGAGVVTDLGAEVDAKWLDQEVIINPALNWGDDQRAQGKEFQILGMPSNGTFAEFINVPVDRLHPKPKHMTWEEAAALPLAGLTAYRALNYRGRLQAGENLLVTGFGGGVAQFAAQFGLAAQANVFVSSSSEAKISKALQLGAKAGYNYQNENWTDQALAETGGFDLIIDGAAGDALNDLVKVAKPGGRIVFYGATLGNPGELAARKIFWNQLNIMGTTMGSDLDFEEMLAFVSKHQIKPLIDEVYNLENASKAFEKMNKGNQLGKLVLVP
ncbi:zinc-binding dehydrogenase [Algoriphagus halophytocola]|uniref:quinone oxidoreductase family protein n=1 Tax=Algoriphagus halophytocola TaxID=2991499 RepID=UPI0022DDAD15|nr:zinc-binding dehydrogenase [Algoriphagus sp. TR-M9]WBL44887.1 zinc-binding dehydrogenase [Algoriphagus sp. TR-M9]